MVADGTKYTLVLRPDEQLSARLEELSRLVTTRFHSQIVLGERMLPHLTILHWYGADLDVLRSQLAGIADYSVGNLTFSGITVEPVANGEKWISIPVFGTEKLRELQRKAIEATAGNGRITSGINDQFKPHITLAHTFDEEISFSQWDAELLRLSSDSWKPCLGVSGEYYVLDSVVSWNG